MILQQTKNRMKIQYLIIICILFVNCGCKEPIVEETPIVQDTPEMKFSNLTTTNHPRLFMSEADFTSLKQKINAGGETPIVKLHNAIMQICNTNGMSSSVLTYTLDASGKRILAVSRNALLRISTCAYAFKITGDEKYLKQAETDINTVCSFKDWNVGHFLDVAEMATAVAIGYDWLYNNLSQTTKNKAEKALSLFALQPANNLSQTGSNFYTWQSNWNQVCNAGVVCAALAGFEKYPLLAKSIIDKAVSTNSPVVASLYNPDGNYSEGRGYWDYGTSYQVVLLSALNSTVGYDGELNRIEGLTKTPEFMLFTSGLNYKSFNFADATEGPEIALGIWWFAYKQNRPDLLFNEINLLNQGKYATLKEEARLLPVFMSFAAKMSITNVDKPTKKIWSGNGITPVIMVRTNWNNDETDKYLGFVGGQASTSHSHMDAGSFVYDAYGVRWASDLGMQMYSTLETTLKALGGDLWNTGQNSLRWTILRLNNFGHGTLTVNDQLHDVFGKGTITKIIETSNELGGTMDLTPVFKNQLSKSSRTVKIINDRDLIVIDSISVTSTASAKIRWQIVTKTAPSIEGGKIVLTSNEKKMYLSATGVSDIKYVTAPASKQKDYDESNPNTYFVGFETTLAAGSSAVIISKLSPDN